VLKLGLFFFLFVSGSARHDDDDDDDDDTRTNSTERNDGGGRDGMDSEYLEKSQELQNDLTFFSGHLELVTKEESSWNILVSSPGTIVETMKIFDDVKHPRLFFEASDHARKSCEYTWCCDN
jgi:hypothetical protein